MKKNIKLSCQSFGREDKHSTIKKIYFNRIEIDLKPSSNDME